MGERTQKWLVITGLVIVCIGLAFGISRVLYHEPVEVSGTAEMETETQEPKLVVEAGDLLVDGVKVQGNENASDTGTWAAFNTVEQELQPEPEKTEEEKPEGAPELAEGVDVENPDETPVYEEEQEDVQEGTAGQESVSGGTSAPSQGAVQNGMIYIEGFGWITDNGGGGSGTTAGDMYENGNKVGIMN